MELFGIMVTIKYYGNIAQVIHLILSQVRFGYIINTIINVYILMVLKMNLLLMKIVLIVININGILRRLMVILILYQQLNKIYA
jgi:hypothetical protein